MGSGHNRCMYVTMAFFHIDGSVLVEMLLFISDVIIFPMLKGQALIKHAGILYNLSAPVALSSLIN